MQNDLTKYSIAIAIPDATANTTAQAFAENLICIYGVPDSIIADQGTNFMSDTF